MAEHSSATQSGFMPVITPRWRPHQQAGSCQRGEIRRVQVEGNAGAIERCRFSGQKLAGNTLIGTDL
jgi:hypothetical protein